MPVEKLSWDSIHCKHHLLIHSLQILGTAILFLENKKWALLRPQYVAIPHHSGAILQHRLRLSYLEIDWSGVFFFKITYFLLKPL
ncbi:MAG: hypothetical protein ROZ36_09455 [Thermincola sp.]|jgi:hypothetical protein|nr:hypothetical protein [Thermincola sp.]